MTKPPRSLAEGHWLLRITTPRFVAGVEVHDGRILRTAPVFGFMRRYQWSAARVAADCRRRGWRVEALPVHDPA